MAFTVKKLSELSGVSVRTLHWYDKVGLLKPAYLGDNGYRYYENEELLLLQQILFFRELGFSLNDIKRVIKSSDFDKASALHVHKKTLKRSLERTKTLIKTIDKTLLHIRGKKKMNEKEFYTGFDSVKQKAYEEYLIKKKGKSAQLLITESKRKTSHWKKADWENVKAKFDKVHKSLTEAIRQGLKPTDSEVQQVISEHFKIVEQFYAPTKEIYQGLSELYLEHPDFKKLYDSYHPELAEFLAQAMRVYAKNELV